MSTNTWSELIAGGGTKASSPATHAGGEINAQAARLLLEQLPACVWTTDLELRITSVHGSHDWESETLPSDPVGLLLGEIKPLNPTERPRIKAHRQALSGQRAEYTSEHLGRVYKCVVEPLTDASGRVSGCLGIAMDITDQQRAIEALAESEARFRELAQSSPDIFWSQSWREDGTREVIFVSPSIEAWWGEPIEEISTFHEQWNRAIHPEDREMAEHSFWHGLEQGSYNREYRVIRPDGQVRWVHDRGRPVRDASGRIIRVSGMTQDITVRKEAQENLARFVEETASESGDALLEAITRRLSKAFGVRWVCITEMDEGSQTRCSSKMILVDGSVCESISYPIEGTPCSSVIREGQRYVVSNLADQYPDDIWLRELGADSYLGTPTFNESGRRVGTVCLMHDTPIDRRPDLLSLLEVCAARAGAELIRIRAEREQARSAQALRESETRFRSVFEMSPLCIHELDTDGRFISINDAGIKILGLAGEQDVIRKRKTDFVSDRDRERVALLMERAMTGEHVSYESGIKTAYGECIMISHYAPVFSESGEVLRLVGVTKDITERTKAQAVKREAEERLSQAQKMESLGLMAGGIAHDFSNLLMAIQGHLELARRVLEADHPASDSLARVEEASRQAVGVTRALLSFTHNEPAQKEPVELCAVVDQTSRLLRRTLPATIELRVEAGAPDGAWTHADKSQLQQIVMNLAVNARDAMPTGGRLDIQVSTDDERDSVVLVTRDTGCGMDEATRRRAIEPYFSTKPRGMGTGLGLSIISAIVKDHGGSMEIESSPGDGTRVTIRLPKHAPGVIASDADVFMPSDRGGGSIALLAENNPHVRSVLGSMLASLGYRVVAVGDGGEALHAGENYRSELGLIVLDVNLPDITGIEVMRRLRAGGARAPGVMISGGAIGGEPSLPDRCVALQKPFMMQDLDEAIHTLIPERTARA